MQATILAIALLMQVSGEAPAPAEPGAPQAAPQGAPVQRAEQPRAFISGHVFSAQTGEPLKGARVQITTVAERRLSTQATVTSPDGNFSFQHLLPGAYGVSVEKPGYEPRALPLPVLLQENQGRSDIEIKVNRSAVIAGRVTDNEGLPVAGALVETGIPRWRNGRRILLRGPSATTDDRGIYRLAGLSPGPYLVGVSIPPDDGPKGDLDLGSARVFYPMATHASEAAALQLSYGQELTEINLVMRPQKTFSVFGVVADAETAGPCRDCVIRAVSLEESYGFSQPQGAVAPDGTYRVRGLPPGSYRITAENNVAGHRMISSHTVQITNRDIGDVNLLAGVQRSIVGRVVFDSEPRAGPKDEPKSGMEVVFATLDGISPAESSRVSRDGTFQVLSLSSETYRVRVQGLPEGAFLKAARVAGRDLPAPEIEAPEGGSPSALELAVSFASGQLAGRVRPPDTDSPATPVTATVALFPLENQSPYLTTMRAGTHPDGGFTLSGIAPGSYVAFAFDRSSRLDWEDPGIQRRMQECGKKVELDPNKQQTVELVLCPEQTQQ